MYVSRCRVPPYTHVAPSMSTCCCAQKVNPHRPTNREGAIAYPLACSLSVRRILRDLSYYLSGLPHFRHSLALSSRPLPFPVRLDQGFFSCKPTVL